VLRRRFGAQPRLAEGATATNLSKLAFARAAKALKLHTPNERVLPTSFRLDAGTPGTLLPA
jgi:hypothetical protein